MDYYNEKVKELIENYYDKAMLYRKQEVFENYFREQRKQHKYMCIFGAGFLGKWIYEWCVQNGIKIDFFCDNYKKTEDEQLYISVEELRKIKKECFVIVSVANQEKKHNDEINMQLQDFPYIVRNPVWFTLHTIGNIKMEKEQLLKKAEELFEVLEDEESKKICYEVIKGWLATEINVYNENPLERYFDSEHYFAKGVIELSNEEVFVDCGAYVGDTLLQFLQKTENKFKKYICFELDKNNCAQLERTIEELDASIRDKIIVYPYGVYSHDKEVSYTNFGMASHIDESDGNATAKLVAMDSLLERSMVTYLKMDVEDAELPALKGAVELIRKNHPKMGISMYHSVEQFFDIPVCIKKIDPEYKIYVRLHSTISHDVICYAV